MHNQYTVNTNAYKIWFFTLVLINIAGGVFLYLWISQINVDSQRSQFHIATLLEKIKSYQNGLETNEGNFTDIDLPDNTSISAQSDPTQGKQSESSQTPPVTTKRSQVHDLQNKHFTTQSVLKQKPFVETRLSNEDIYPKNKKSRINTGCKRKRQTYLMWM
ncbi:MAG: hypothetical protein OMM_00653 [Candidatus Magnetoglobus multicellularis str. Araruama]|uniref:Uncharacterized protein n=1 Tax=Candidatus Magnetoglobus multicellularis str. Araruama TaxID=890399 RepID=A0A1V1PGC5_9BACT|nr:MAG: hypothetical protein OMM_00653 [Candidatus Magnetoglobus multicellularis str. Araruama]